MGSDRQIDPRTRDYVPNGTGGVVQTKTAASGLYHALATQRGSVATDPKAGSRLAELKTRTADTAPLAEQIALLAVEPLDNAGRISGPQAVAEIDDQGNLLLRVQARDGSGETLEVQVDV